MTLPTGVVTKTMVFGRYSSVLGNNRGGNIKVGFADSMLHLPTGEVVTSGLEAIAVNPDTGSAQITVPVTDDPELVANWRESSAYTGQRLTIDVAIDGYAPGRFFVDVPSDMPDFIDFDQMSKYATPTGIEVVRAEVLAVAGLTGTISATQLAEVMQPYLETGAVSDETIEMISQTVQEDLEPPVTLTLLFDNALA